MSSIRDRIRGNQQTDIIQATNPFNKLLNAEKADKIVSALIKCCWEALGNDGEPPALTSLEYALPSELDHHGSIRSALDRNLNRWQSKVYFLLFECFRAIGLDVRKATITEWEQIDVREGDSSEIYDEKMLKLDEAVYFVFDQETLLFNENPEWIASILEINNFSTMDSDKIYNQHRKLIPFEYSEEQKKCASFDRLYFDLSSLIHYITQHYTTHSRKKKIDTQPVRPISLRIMAEQIESIHSFWKFCRQIDNSLKHPLAPIIRQWQMVQIPEIEPDRRKTQIAPAFLKESQMDDLNAQLPVGQFHEGADIQAYLPGFEPSPSVIVAALPLDIYTSAEKSPIPGGSGAPLAQRLFISGLLAYPYGERQRDGSVKLTSSLRDLRDWAYPKGWTRKYDLPRIIKALHEVHNMRIRWERRSWNVVQVFGMPNSETKLDDPVPLRIELPEGVSGNGAMIDVFALRLYGTISAPKFRAWIRLAYFWDDAKIKNGGFRIFARRPKVLRNSDGYLTNTQGQVIRSGNLYSTSQGWKFRDGNIPQTAWYHPLAVVVGDEPNPQVHKVPVLSDEDMIQLFFDNQQLTQSAFWKRLHDSRKHAEQMEKEGRIKIQTDQIDAKREIKGWRILQPRPPKQAEHVYR